MTRVRKPIDSYQGMPSQIAEKSELGDWSLERARLQAAPHIMSKELRHGWEAVSFQTPPPAVFPQPLQEYRNRAETIRHQPLRRIAVQNTQGFYDR